MSEIYYSDPHKFELKTTVKKVNTSSDGFHVYLDDTIIYPGGGGQIMDRAHIDNLPVKQARNDNDSVCYVLNNSPSFQQGDQVLVKIDGDFRLYNMQQHTGQHLLSAVMKDMGLTTVSVHLGEEYTLIEVEGKIPGRQEISSIERRSNELIRKAIPVQTHWMDKSATEKLKLRKTPGDFKRLRIVSIEELDHSACGGTHVANTAEIGLIKYVGMEKIRGNARLQFKIGLQAYSLFEQLHVLHKDLNKILQTSAEKAVDRITNLLDEKKLLEKKINNLQKQSLPLVADQILREQQNKDTIISWLDEDGEYSGALAKKLHNMSGKAVIIFTENRFYYLGSTEDENFRNWLNNDGPKFGMRGGGPAGFIQGIYNSKQRSELKSAIQIYFSHKNLSF